MPTMQKPISYSSKEDISPIYLWLAGFFSLGMIYFIIISLVESNNEHNQVNQLLITDRIRILDKISRYKEDNVKLIGPCINFKGNCCHMRAYWHYRTWRNSYSRSIDTLDLPCSEIPNIVALDASISISLNSVSLNSDIRRGM